jgi:hypothetical protein
MQINIAQGIYTASSPDLLAALPVNMRLVPQVNEVSGQGGNLRPIDGVRHLGPGFGEISRGVIRPTGYALDGVIRVVGNRLYRYHGNQITALLDSSGQPIVIEQDLNDPERPARLDYGFDNISIASNNKLYLYNYKEGQVGTTGQVFVEITDPDLGIVKDAIFIDGYYMTTDGEFIVVSDIDDPTSYSPFKYGSSEIDPDEVVALLKIRNEVYVVNKNTIEVFNNVGGNGFPFRRVEGGQIMRGAVGRDACCVYMDSIAFLGNYRNESPAIYIGINGTSKKISTQTIDKMLKNYTAEQLAKVRFEVKKGNSLDELLVHLPDQTLVFDASVGATVGGGYVWHIMSSSESSVGKYNYRDFWYDSNQWVVCDHLTGAACELDDNIATQNNKIIPWEFSTGFIYNAGNGAIVNELELVAVTGRNGQQSTNDDNPTITTSYSVDGLVWSQDRRISTGKPGDRTKRLVWRQQGMLRNFRIQRFQGDSRAFINVLRLEAQIEPMAY